MRIWRNVGFGATAVVACAASCRCGAQATRLIDPFDPLTAGAGILAANGLAPQFILGQRPYSRAELVRLVVAATRALSSVDTTTVATSSNAASHRFDPSRLEFLREVVASMAERLEVTDTIAYQGADAPAALVIAPLRSASVDYTYSSGASRAIPRDNGLGAIDAVLNPLLAYRGGRPLNQGSNALLSTSHSVESRFVALFAEPELLAHSVNGEEKLDARLQQLSLRVIYHNVALDAGREYLIWGQGREGGLLGSLNAPPLDLLRLSSEMPFRLPWLLRHLGPTKASSFYADLGGDQNFPHPYFVGYKFSILPSDRLELGVSVYTKAGGHGSPRASFSARVVDAFPFLDAAFYGGLIGTRGKYEFSDRYAGVDGRWRLPRLASAEFYWELLLNDFDVRRLGSVLWEDAGHIAGVTLPRLTASGRLAGSVELHHTGLRYYEHHQFTSGQTLHRILIGDALGPDALGAFATVDWYASARHRFSIDAAVENRSSDRYALREGPGFGFQRVQSNPRERRARLTASWRTAPQHNALAFVTQAGLEHTRNFDFARGVQRTAVLGRAALEYRFR